MTRYFDIPAEVASHFPAHGWITGSTGVRHLRLPILRLYQLGNPGYERFTDNNLAGMWLQSRSPYRSLRQLAVALRDLHAELRTVLPIMQSDWPAREPSGERNDALTRLREGYERIEVALIAIFVVVRRLADEVIDASRPLLFGSWQSAPRQMKSAISMAREGTLSKAGPRCDGKLLTDTLLAHTAWFEQLRQDEGIRDILVHKDHILQVGGQGTRSQGTTEISWRITANLVRGMPGALKVLNLFPALRDCVAGACRFMEMLYRCAGNFDGYQQGDVLFLTGSDADICGFWPSIAGTQKEFPLN